MAFTFNGASKLIVMDAGTTEASVRDLWSRWVDWFVTGDNSKYPVAFSSLGGDDIDTVAGTKVPVYAFLQNGWRLRPQEASHTLSITDGILLVAGGGDPFVATLGSYVVRVNYQQPVQAISFSSGGGGGIAASDVWQDHEIEGGFNAEQALRLILAAVQGKVSGAATSTIRFRDIADTKDRLVATTDTDGNRTAITRDAT